MATRMRTGERKSYLETAGRLTLVTFDPETLERVCTHDGGTAVSVVHDALELQRAGARRLTVILLDATPPMKRVRTYQELRELAEAARKEGNA